MKFFSVFLFLAGIIFFNTAANAAVFYSQNSGNPANLDNWNTNRNGGGANPSGFSSGDIFVVQNFHTLATGNNWQISGTGARLKIETGGHLDVFHRVDLNNTVLEISTGGIFNVVSGVFNLNGSASINSSGAMFLHDSDLKIDGSLILDGGGLSVRGASHLTMNSDSASRLEIGAGAFFNWTDDGNRSKKSAATSGIFIVGGGGVLNNGTLRFNGGGGNCGDSDTILIRSTVSQTARVWAGQGSFTLIDVDIKDQSRNSMGISAQNSTDSGNNTNFWFNPCVPMTASARVGGKVITNTGRGIPNTILTLTNLTRGDVIVRRTNSSGYFHFYDLEVGDNFLIQARHKFYGFSGGITFFLVGDREDIEFIGNF